MVSRQKKIIEKIYKLRKNKGKKILVKVNGNSMFPLFHKGDKLKITQFTNKIRLGDIVVYNLKERFIIHRVVKVEKNFFLPKAIIINI